MKSWLSPRMKVCRSSSCTWTTCDRLSTIQETRERGWRTVGRLASVIWPSTTGNSLRKPGNEARVIVKGRTCHVSPRSTGTMLLKEMQTRRSNHVHQQTLLITLPDQDIEITPTPTEVLFFCLATTCPRSLNAKGTIWKTAEFFSKLWRAISTIKTWRRADDVLDVHCSFVDTWIPVAGVKVSPSTVTEWSEAVDGNKIPTLRLSPYDSEKTELIKLEHMNPF